MMPPRALTLDDGRRVALGERTPGGSKNQTTYGTLSSGEPVVVKIETVHGRLATEMVALRYAGQHGVRVPRLVGSGRTAGDSGDHLFLVLSREDGVRSTVPEGWYRLGRDLATLVRVPIVGWPLARRSPREFAEDHEARLALVESLLGTRLAAKIRVAIACVAAGDSLVFTHGDPGSGNYLDTGQVGVLLDWENALVGPFGVDAGRAAFIALMDLGGTGRGAEMQAAVVAGYRKGLGGSSGLGDELLAASTVVAGLQFVHGRFVEPLRPERTPEAAAATLEAYLAAL